MKIMVPFFAKFRLIFSVFVLFFGLTMQSLSTGVAESYAILGINGGPDAYYDMKALTVIPDLNGTALGTFQLGTGSLVVRGGQNKTFKNGGCNVTGSNILYRVYKTGTPVGLYHNCRRTIYHKY